MNFRPVAVALACALLPTISYAQAVKGDPAKAQPIVSQVCAACHQLNGEGRGRAPDRSFLMVAGDRTFVRLRRWDWRRLRGRLRTRDGPRWG